MEYVFLIGGWILYFGLHSLLAASSVKRSAEHRLGKGFRYYRLGYSLISLVGLVGLLFLSGSIPAAYFFSSEGVIRYVSLVFTTFGVILIQVSFRQYNLKGFLGLEPEAQHLRSDGILRWVRHPIYSGVILITVGFFLFIPNLPSLVSCLCILAYLPVGIMLEEKKLISSFGEAYRSYRKEVPALIPRWSRLKGR
jgi:methanethiol S-methyltransferase